MLHCVCESLEILKNSKIFKDLQESLPILKTFKETSRYRTHHEKGLKRCKITSLGGKDVKFNFCSGKSREKQTSFLKVSKTPKIFKTHKVSWKSLKKGQDRMPNGFSAENGWENLSTAVKWRYWYCLATHLQKKWLKEFVRRFVHFSFFRRFRRLSLTGTAFWSPRVCLYACLGGLLHQGCQFWYFRIEKKRSVCQDFHGCSSLHFVSKPETSRIFAYSELFQVLHLLPNSPFLSLEIEFC